LIALPKEVADAHLYGTIHLSYMYDWILKPIEVIFNPVFHVKSKKMTHGIPINFRDETIDPETTGTTYLTTIARETSRAMTLFLNFAEISEWQWIKKNLETFLSSYSGKIGLYLRLNDGFDTEILERFAEDISRMGKRVLLDDLLLSFNLAQLDEEFFRKYLLSAEGIANLGGRVSIFNCSNEFLTTWGLEQVPILPKSQEDIVYLLGMSTLNLPKISRLAKDKESRFFEILRESIRLSIKGFLIKQRALLSRFREGGLPSLESHEGDSITLTKRTYSLVNIAGLAEASTMITGEETLLGAANLSMYSKILSSIKAAIKRESVGQHLNVFPTYSKDAEVMNRLTKMWRDDVGEETLLKIQQAKTKEKDTVEAKLREEIYSLKSVLVDIDSIQNPESEILNLLKSGFQMVNISSRRNMCGECGSIVPWGTSLCSYCGSRRRIRIEEPL
jgi:hypothetical protein